MTETRKAGRPIGAKNKHPQILRIDINLADTRGLKNMTDLTINQVGAKLYQARDSLEKVTKCKKMLSEIAETKDSVAGFDSVIETFKDASEKLAAELAERKALVDRFLKVCIDGNREWTKEASYLRGDATGGQGKIIKKRELLIEAGISEEETLKLLPDFDGSELIAKAEAIEAKRDQWLKFQSTGLQADLPSDAEEVLPFFGQYGGRWDVIR